MAEQLSQQIIAITRPEGQATRLTRMIEAAGAKSLAFPLIAIAPLDDYQIVDTQFAELDRYDWLFFISSNAVNHALPRMQAQWPKGLPSTLKFAAIGPSTAQTLANYGVDKVLIPEGRFDSEALLSLPELQDMTNKKAMIVRGVGGRELLATALSERGAEVAFAECYQRVNPQTNCDTIFNESLKAVCCDAMVVTSSEAMRSLLTLAKINDENKNQHWLNQVKLCVNLPRVADSASQLGLSTFIAGEPGDEAMLNCLKDALLR